jgi:trans-aconitate 2-methyltransferase
MIAAARERLAGSAGRVNFVRADLTRPLPLTEPVDAIVSTATFHWVPDHDALFRDLAGVLRPGGTLVAQCGGHGNIASVMAALDELAPDADRIWVFATPEETEARLRSAGFVEAHAWLHDEPTDIPPEDFETYLATIILGSHLATMPEAERARFVHDVAVRLPGPRLDYVRLNIVATRGVDP